MPTIVSTSNITSYKHSLSPSLSDFMHNLLAQLSVDIRNHHSRTFFGKDFRSRPAELMILIL